MISRPFVDAVLEGRGAAADLTALAGRVRGRQEQRLWLLTTAVMGLIVGVALWYVAAGLLPRNIGDRIAASLIGGDRWHAGLALMEEASPDSWDKMVRLYNACPPDAATELCEAAIVARTAAPSRTLPREPNRTNSQKP
jgi:hypothetical protein